MRSSVHQQPLFTSWSYICKTGEGNLLGPDCPWQVLQATQSCPPLSLVGTAAGIPCFLPELLNIEKQCTYSATFEGMWHVPSCTWPSLMARARDKPWTPLWLVGGSSPRALRSMGRWLYLAATQWLYGSPKSVPSPPLFIYTNSG